MPTLALRVSRHLKAGATNPTRRGSEGLVRRGVARRQKGGGSASIRGRRLASSCAGLLAPSQRAAPAAVARTRRHSGGPRAPHVWHRTPCLNLSGGMDGFRAARWNGGTWWIVGCRSTCRTESSPKRGSAARPRGRNAIHAQLACEN